MARCLSSGRMRALAGLIVALSLITAVNGARLRLENGQAESAAAILSSERGGERGFGRNLLQAETPVACSPCTEATPTVYFSTGSGATPANGIWRINAFDTADTSTPRAIEFLCTLTGLSGQVADIAVSYYGDLIVLDTGANLYYYPSINETAGTTNYAMPCNLMQANLRLGRLSDSSLLILPSSTITPTGLAHGFTSDSFVVTTNDGSAVPFTLQYTPGGSKRYVVAAATNGVRVAGGPTTVCYTGTPRNTGGTDITAGPDGNFYRFCAKEKGTQYSGSRYLTSGTSYISGWDGYVSNGIHNDTNLSNGGAFCTSTTVVGVAAQVAKTTEHPVAGSCTYFVTFGHVNGSPTTPTAYATSNDTLLPKAQLIGETVDITDVPGRLRINGAATQCK